MNAEEVNKVHDLVREAIEEAKAYKRVQRSVMADALGDDAARRAGMARLKAQRIQRDDAIGHVTFSMLAVAEQELWSETHE